MAQFAQGAYPTISATVYQTADRNHLIEVCMKNKSKQIRLDMGDTPESEVMEECVHHIRQALDDLLRDSKREVKHDATVPDTSRSQR